VLMAGPVLAGGAGVAMAPPASADATGCDNYFCINVTGDGTYVGHLKAYTSWANAHTGHPELAGPNGFSKNGPEGSWGEGGTWTSYTVDLNKNMPAGQYCARFWALNGGTGGSGYTMIAQACEWVG
jgi:hypothetical protein